MALHLTQCHHIEALLDPLAGALAAGTDPFVPATVITDSAGVRAWLQWQLARRDGVVAGHRWRTLDALLAELAGTPTPVWSIAALRWRVYACLRDTPTSVAGDGPAQRFIGDGPAADTQRMALAGLCASAFYSAGARADVVAELNDPADDRWDARLWRQATAPPVDPALPHLVPPCAQLNALGSDTAAPSSPVVVFNVNQLGAHHVALLAHLAERADVWVFALSPGPAASQASALPLLRSLGAQLRARDATLALAQPSVTTLASSPTASHNLAALQRALVSPAAPIPARSDPSLQIHACPSAQRQVEVLRDALLAALDADPTLEHRDLLVITPDLTTYAPLVQAVFSDGAPWDTRHSHPGGLPALPVRIAGRGVSAGSPAGVALLDALALAGTRLTASAVLDVLTAAPVLSHAGLSPDDVPALRTLVGDASVRWGRDAGHHAAVDVPLAGAHSWRFAVDRLLLGIAVREGDAPILGVLPDVPPQAGDRRRLVTGLLTVAAPLLDQISALDNGERPPADWIRVLNAVADGLLGADHDDRQDLSEAIANTLEGASGPISLGALLPVLTAHLAAQTGGAAWPSGSVTLATPTTLHGVPFRVIALLGLDDGALPRSATPTDLDRVALAPQVGDPSPRDLDRLVLLEATLSARDTLIICGTQPDPKTHGAQPFASPVEDLRDTLVRVFTAPADGTAHRDLFLHRHPLQPWDTAALSVTGAPDLRTHDRRALAWAEALQAPSTTPRFLTVAVPAPALPAVPLALLTRFLKDPAQRLLSHALHLYPQDDPDAVLDEEPLALDNLQRWAVRRDLLAALRSTSLCDRADARDRVYTRLRLAGRLPIGLAGRLAFDDASKTVDELLAAAQDALASPPLAPHTVTLTCGAHTVTGRVDDRTEAGLARVQAGTVRGPHVLALWVCHLAECATPRETRSTLVGPNGRWILRPVSASAAVEHLTTLATLLTQGLTEATAFYPDTALTTFLRDAAAAKKAWGGTYGEPSAAAVRLFGDAFPYAEDGEHDDTPIALAHRVWDPVLAATEEHP